MCFGVVHVICRWTNIPCPWTDSVPAVHGGPHTTHPKKRSASTSFRRRYSDNVHVIRQLRSFFEICLHTMYGHRRFVDAQQSAFNSTPRRMRCCDVRRAVSNIRFHGKPHALATILSRLPVGYVTWASTWIPSLHEDSRFQNCIGLLIL